MKNKKTKIQLSKSTITKLNNTSEEMIKGGSSLDSFLDCFTRGNCTGAGTGVLCY